MFICFYFLVGFKMGGGEIWYFILMVVSSSRLAISIAFIELTIKSKKSTFDYG